MIQFSIPLSDNTLMVRDEQGVYCPATPEQVIAAARNVMDARLVRGRTFNDPVSAKNFLIAKLGGQEREIFACAFLDTRHHLIEYRELFAGSIDSAEVHPREVVKAALHCNAAAVCLAHNHPSGSLEPSRADRALTDRLKDALALVDVRTLDHIIVGGSKASSFAERGLL